MKDDSAIKEKINANTKEIVELAKYVLENIGTESPIMAIVMDTVMQAYLAERFPNPALIYTEPSKE